MKRFCAIIVLIIIGCLTSFNSFAQKRTIKAKLHKEEVEGVSREGAAIEIELNNKSIVKEWESTLKTYGKLTKLKGDAYKVTEATFPGVTGNCVIYAKCYSNSKGYLAWWSIDNGTHITSNSKHSESKLEEFARQQYINDVNEQIEDAEDALKSATKIYEKQVNKGENLVKDISKNEKEREKLEQAIKDNEADLIRLQKEKEENLSAQAKAKDSKTHEKEVSRAADLAKDLSKNGPEKIKLEQNLRDNIAESKELKKDLENNKDDQKKAAEDVNKMQKALEVVKAKLNNI